jgi:hypothetical protein
MIKRNVRFVVGSLFLLLLVLGGPVWLAQRQLRIESLNRALVSSVKQKDLAAVTRLLEKGADPNTLDVPSKPSGNLWTIFLQFARPTRQPSYPPVLMRAANGGHTDIVKALVEHGAEVNARSYGSTALLSAVSNGYTETARYLLDQGADIDAAGMEGNTPLIRAVWSGRLSMVRLIVERGADADRKNQHGLTALDYALEAYRHRPHYTIGPVQGGDAKTRAMLMRRLRQKVAREEATRRQNCYTVIQLLRQALTQP